MGSDTVTIRTDQIALCNLSQEFLAGMEEHLAYRSVFSSSDVVEIYDVVRVSVLAVHARL